jgi:hypothetical protein
MSTSISDALAVPPELTDAELALARGEVAPEPTPAPAPPAPETELARPALNPPGTPGAVNTVPAGFSSVRVLALFSSGDPENGQANLDGIGWRRVAATNDSAHVNLSLLAAAARMQGTATPIRHDADNQVHEIYLW